MNNPDLYHKVSEVQRYDSQKIIVEYSTKIQWRYDGHDSLIDLGSGCGDALMEFVYPRMPRNFKRLVCSDINPKMVNYARQQYDHIKGSEFRVLDMETLRRLPSDLEGNFDHVMSFYVLHWIQNQRQALENIYHLLRPEGGDCLLVILASHPIIGAFRLTSQMEKWSRFMFDMDSRITAPMQTSKNPGEDFSKLLSEVGFSDYTVEMQEREFVYGSLEIYKENVGGSE
ncbi:juvenile hormone acid O-methyltransferase-like [Haematobia irritans]|uniref:juvenile hormone acid O-methyltransferase-like n=1 Tax=Haematobia irritans TaxID=7368 RepID=UPI003F506514